MKAEKKITRPLIILANKKHFTYTVLFLFYFIDEENVPSPQKACIIVGILKGKLSQDVNKAVTSGQNILYATTYSLARREIIQMGER